ncbi:MAG: XrtN system VIT domain-containing protein [Chitinophagales bacterium]
MNFTRKFGVIANLIAGITFFVLLTGHQMEWISDDALSIVFINVILCTVYSITCLANLFRHKKIDSLGLPLLYSLWTISCFSLNLLFDVFENTTYWVYILLAIFFISSYWIYHQKEKHQKLAFYLNGVSFLLVIYFTVYLIPLIPISALVIILLGLGLHGFAPLLISILHISTLISKLNTEKINWYYFFSGIGSVLLLIGVFTILLNMESTKLVNSKTIFQFESNEELLDWVQISQRVKPNFINEILLKKGLVYNSIDEFWTMSRFDFGSSKQYNERKIHDPFILTCFSLTKDPSISKDDRIKILEANFDNRSQTEHQLWSGDNLETKAIKEDVYLFEKERLAYTELTMDIANNSKWGQGEAIYSFQLPEGAVATSLSLWVNGVERKGVLTSKSKAKKAYDQIVGVEARDPSLLQWREGNRIVCRIFPVTKEMPRQFKLGITSPFSMENNQMKYDNISIKGPSMAEAKIISRVRSKSLEKVSTSSKFDTEANQLIRSSQGYTKWNASLPRATLTPIHFQWKGFNYTVINPIYDTAQTDLSEVYFDLNSNWEETEIKKILGQLDPKFSCYTFINGEQVRIEKSNLKNIIK